MSRSATLAFAVAAILVSGSALAQSAGGAPRLEITLSPAGSTGFTHNDAEPHFTNWRAGIGIGVNLTSVVGLEGEFGGSFGIEQSMLAPTPDLHPGHNPGPTTRRVKSPNVFDYNANLVVSIPTGGSVVPYVTGGIGGLTLLKREEVLLADDETFLTGNVGGGLKWFSASRRWGLRADYRLIAVNANEDASSFFGRQTRYGNRFYGAVLVGLGQ